MFFLTQAHDDALLAAEEVQDSRWWVELQGHPEHPACRVSQAMMSEGLWFAAMSSMNKLAMQSRALHSVSTLQQRQLMADKFIYKAQVLQEFFDILQRERIIVKNSEASVQMQEMLATMQTNFPARA